jgi:hypothetical protein
MKYIEKEHHQELVEELQVISGKKFTSDQFTRLFEGFKKIPWIQACQIVRDFERLERFPTNIYGVIANRIEDKFRESTKEKYAAASWRISSDEMASANEWDLWWKIIEEAKLWITLGLDVYHTEYAHITDLPPEGQSVHSWSKVIDYVLEHWFKFQKQFPISKPDKREKFLQICLENLMKQRQKLTPANKPVEI